jgi:hypothetical protein
MWFYVLFTIPSGYRFLVASIVSEKAIRIILRWRIWAKFILFGMGFIKSKKPGVGT